MNEPILGVIFDLDGVIVSTDDCHYLAWKRMADEEGIPFDRKVNERLRGVSRMASLEIILEKATKTYTEEQKVEMATRKNGYYVELIQQLTADAMLPGAMATLEMLKKRGVKNIHFMCIIAAPEGVKRLTEAHPDVDVYIGALDDHLNEHKYIVPGLGDAGDRIFGTK